MNVTISLHVEGLEEAQAVLAALSGVAPATVEAAEDKPKKRGRPKKAKAEEVVDDDPLGLDADETEDEEPTVTRDDVKAALGKFLQVNDTKAGVELLKKFKAKTLNDVKPKDYPKLLDALADV